MLYPPLPMHEQIRRPYQPPPEYWDEKFIPSVKNEPVPARGKGRWMRGEYEKEGGMIVDLVMKCITECEPIGAPRIHEKLPNISGRAIRGACSDLIASGKIVFEENKSKTLRTYRIRKRGEARSHLRVRKREMQEKIMEALKRKKWMTTEEIALEIGLLATLTSRICSTLRKRELIMRREGAEKYEYALTEDKTEETAA